VIADLKRVMVDVTKIEAITPMLTKYESYGCEYKVQIGGVVYRIDNRDYPRDILIKHWEEVKK
jgi:hypothetical protein